MQHIDASGYRLRVLPPPEVELSWQKIGQLLEPATAFCNGEFTVDDIKQSVKDGQAFIMVLESAAGIELAAACQVLTLPRKRVLHVQALGGARLNVMLLAFWDQIQNIGRILGVDSVRGAVRPSMQRYYRRISPASFVAYTIMERKL